MPEELEHSPKLTTETEVPETNPIAAVAGQFGLNGQIFLAQLLNFLIVLVILWRFVYKPVVHFLDERAEKIEKSVSEAQAIEKRIKEIEVEREDVINQARKESAEILEKAYQNAETRGAEIISAAKREVERVIAKGKQSLASEQDSMIRELRKEIIDLAMKAATRIVQNEVDEKKSKSIAEEVVRKLS